MRPREGLRHRCALTARPILMGLREVGQPLIARASVAVAALFLVSAAVGHSETPTRNIAKCPTRGSTILNPVASPDGTQIAWLSSCRGSTVQVWIASASGSNAHLLASNIPALYQLAWVRAAGLLYTVINDQLWHLSKDGTRSLVVSQFQPSAQQIPADAAGDRVAWGVLRCACQGAIQVKSLVGGWTRAVANNPSFSDDNPTLSPDGRRVAFERRLCPKFAECRKLAGIWVSSIAGGHPQRIARSGYFPVWAPDGRWILYDDGHGHLVVIAPNGHRRMTLPVAGMAKAPAPNFAWSPDSRSIAVWSQGPLRVFNVGSGRSSAVTAATLGDVTGFAWAPDSRTLLVATAKSSSCPSLWSVRADGSAKRMLRRC
jgi:Tol biopolymer transport system component